MAETKKKRQYRLYVGIYEDCTNAQACFISDKPEMFLGLRALEDFLRENFCNFTKITFFSNKPNLWLATKEFKYKDFEKFEEKQNYDY